MQTDEHKRELALRVVKLMLREPTVTGTGITEEYRDQIRDRHYKEQTDLRVKHFSTEQLEALLNFYQSDIGKSILESQNRMIDDMGFQIVSHDIESGE